MEKRLRQGCDNLSPRATASERLRRELRVEGERLRIRHRLGLGGIELTRRRSNLVDQLIHRAWQLSLPAGASPSGAIVALGGYGRGELAPLSDIDLLFLSGHRQANEAKAVFERVLYLLWDAGLVVGHSLRTIGDCVAMARHDLHSRTALATARLLAGEDKLFTRLSSELERKVYQDKGENERFLEALRLEIKSRYEKYGRAVCLLEPNLKESAGGLRDLHAVEWLGHDLFGAKNIEELRAAAFISDGEYRVARRAYDFIARVRNEAHFTTARKTDLLTLDLQPQLAANLGYQHRRSLLDSEVFMRDYYQRASDLHRFCENFLARALGGRGKKRLLGARAKPVAAGFEIKEGKLDLREPHISLADPGQLMQAFFVSQMEAAPLSEDLKLTIEKHLKLVNQEFRARPETARLFRELLRHRGRAGASLRMMHEAGMLGRVVPEFARITFLVQHDFYHRYTIDEHTLRALETIDRLALEEDPKALRLKAILAEVEDASILYLGLLLHDIGKGHGKGHVARGVRIAERVCQRLKLEDEARSDVVFLVEQHLLMSHLAERRDLSETGVIEEFTSKIGTLPRLNLLMLLTYADSSAVAPGVWNDWKAALLWDLYTRARQQLMPAPALTDPDPVMARKQEVMNNLKPGFLPSQVERHFAMLPERYARAHDAGQITRHIELVHRMGSASIVVDWRQLEDRHCTELVVCARDHKGLFAQIAGALTACGVNILSTDLCTREDGVALDTFKLSQIGSHHPIRAEHWSRIEQKLRAAIDDSPEGGYEVAAAVETWLAKATHRRRPSSRPRRLPGIAFDSDSSPVSTIIEVTADDEPGLAYRIAATLAALDINIRFARITTEKNRALDIFYVDAAGKKLSPAEMDEVEGALMETLTKPSEKEKR